MLYIGDQPTLWGVDARRQQGHIDALREAGIEWNDGRYFMISKDRKLREHDLNTLCRRIGTQKETVWVFISDYYAVEAMDYLTDHGYRVPEDISVTGFDDNILAHVIRPRLTTVHQDVTKKAEAAVRAMIGILQGQQEQPVNIVQNTRTVHGNSIRILNLKK